MIQYEIGGRTNRVIAAVGVILVGALMPFFREGYGHDRPWN